MTSATQYRQPFGTFIEGFDSILYSESRRQANRLRLLAELFYGMTYDSCIVIPEPVANDNYVVVRLLRMMQDRGLDKFRESLVYVPYRDLKSFVEKALLNVDFVCSSLSSNIERERIDYLKQGQKPTDIFKSAAELIEYLLKSNQATTEDQLVLQSHEKLIKGDAPWIRQSTPIVNHGFSLFEQIREWLALDWNQYGELSESKVCSLLEKQDFWPQIVNSPVGQTIQPWQSDPIIRFNSYFNSRSYFHKVMPLWRQELGDATFGRLEEYVNSAYGIALQKTCGAYTAVRTPTDIGNQNNTTAQQIMNGPDSTNNNAFEFYLNLEHLNLGDDLYDRTEEAMLTCLDDMLKETTYLELKQQMLALKPHDSDYESKFVDTFGKIANFVNGLNGPFTLEIQGNYVINILERVSFCKREILGEREFQDANGCEHRNC